jgi:hypothetical protein
MGAFVPKSTDEAESGVISGFHIANERDGERSNPDGDAFNNLGHILNFLKKKG